MSQKILTPRPRPIIYPDSDGKRMAENTEQFDWIVTIKEGHEALLATNANVFVAGDLLWYPVEGHPEIRQAPDTMVAFGRPKGRRGSYMQWEEGNIAPQVVYEVLSPENRKAEMDRKFEFYDRYGVEEYYIYDPDRGKLRGWIRVQGKLQEIDNMNGWVSPRLGIRFELVGKELRVYGPDGRRFAKFQEIVVERNELERDAKTQRLRREEAEQEKQQAEQQKNAAERQASQYAEEVERLRKKLQALGLDPDV